MKVATYIPSSIEVTTCLRLDNMLTVGEVGMFGVLEIFSWSIHFYKGNRQLVKVVVSAVFVLLCDLRLARQVPQYKDFFPNLTRN